jgi:hypothetical protein
VFSSCLAEPNSRSIASRHTNLYFAAVRRCADAPRESRNDNEIVPATKYAFDACAPPSGLRELVEIGSREPTALIANDIEGAAALRELRERAGGTGLFAGICVHPQASARSHRSSRILANPDLPERFRRRAALNVPDKATFYSPGTPGYTDYPTLDALA